MDRGEGCAPSVKIHIDEAKEENWTRETETASFEPSPRRPGKRDRFSRFLSSDP